MQRDVGCIMPIWFLQEPMRQLTEKGKCDLFRSEAYQSNFELTSKEKVDSIGVIASSAVCW